MGVFGARFSLDLEPSMTIKEVKEKAHEPSEVPGTCRHFWKTKDIQRLMCGYTEGCNYLLCAAYVQYAYVCINSRVDRLD